MKKKKTKKRLRTGTWKKRVSWSSDLDARALLFSILVNITGFNC